MIAIQQHFEKLFPVKKDVDQTLIKAMSDETTHLIRIFSNKLTTAHHYDCCTTLINNFKTKWFKKFTNVEERALVISQIELLECWLNKYIFSPESCDSCQ